jgi:chromosome segregation ATPase
MRNMKKELEETQDIVEEIALEQDDIGVGMDDLLEEIENLENDLATKKKELLEKIQATNERISKNNAVQNIKNKQTAEKLATQKQDLEAQTARVDNVLVQLETIKANINSKMNTEDVVRLL